MVKRDNKGASQGRRKKLAQEAATVPVPFCHFGLPRSPGFFFDRLVLHISSKLDKRFRRLVFSLLLSFIDRRQGGALILH